MHPAERSIRHRIALEGPLTVAAVNDPPTLDSLSNLALLPNRLGWC